MGDRDLKPENVDVFVCPAGCRCECASGGPCAHDWSGPTREEPVGDNGAMASTATCARCGLGAMEHDLWVLP